MSEMLICQKIFILELPKICYIIEQLIQINKVIIKKKFHNRFTNSGVFPTKTKNFNMIFAPTEWDPGTFTSAKVVMIIGEFCQSYLWALV